jgi:hypothetical protein
MKLCLERDGRSATLKTDAKKTFVGGGRDQLQGCSGTMSSYCQGLHAQQSLSLASSHCSSA